MRVVPVTKYKGVERDNILFLLGNGESIKEIDLSFIPIENKVAINRAWKFGPAKYHVLNYDTAFFTDAEKYQPKILFSHGKLEEISGSTKEKLDCDLTMIPRKPKLASLDLAFGWRPSHAGLLAIHLSWYMQADIIFLVGYDGYGGHFEESPTMKYPASLIQEDHDRHKVELQEFYAKARTENYSTRIYNTNSSNAYGVFPVRPMEEAMEYLKRNQKRKIN